jgi:hypothetical protein
VRGLQLCGGLFDRGEFLLGRLLRRAQLVRRATLCLGIRERCVEVRLELAEPALKLRDDLLLRRQRGSRIVKLE